MRMVSLLFGLFFSLLSFNASAKDYIVGGQDVGPDDPIRASTVGIFESAADGRSGSLCTGTLIRKDVAVTAAHCLQPGGLSPLVIFGNDLHSPNAPHRASDGVVVNPKWKTHAGRGMDQGDIALVKFDGGLPKGYRKISTVRSDSDIRTGSNVVLAGYGISDAAKKTGAGTLRKTEVRILKSREHRSEMIVDQSRGHGACHGDSGGPAFIAKNGKMVLAGVTNRGYPSRASDNCRHQAVYTKVPAYKSWIQENAKKLESAPPVRQPLLSKKISRLKSRRPKMRKLKSRHRR